MESVEEIRKLEDLLVQAELKPDPDFFRDILNEDAILDGFRAKNQVAAAHQPGGSAKFAKVEMTDFEFSPHGPD